MDLHTTSLSPAIPVTYKTMSSEGIQRDDKRRLLLLVVVFFNSRSEIWKPQIKTPLTDTGDSWILTNTNTNTKFQKN